MLKKLNLSSTALHFMVQVYHKNGRSTGWGFCSDGWILLSDKVDQSNHPNPWHFPSKETNNGSITSCPCIILFGLEMYATRLYYIFLPSRHLIGEDGRY